MARFCFLWLLQLFSMAAAYLPFPIAPRAPLFPSMPHMYSMWPELFPLEPHPRRAHRLLAPRWQVMGAHPPHWMHIAKRPNAEVEKASLRVGGFRFLPEIQASLSADGTSLTLEGTRRLENVYGGHTLVSKSTSLEMPFHSIEPADVRIIRDRDGILSVIVHSGHGECEERDAPSTALAENAAKRSNTADAVEAKPGVGATLDAQASTPKDGKASYEHAHTTDTGNVKPGVDATLEALEEKFASVGKTSNADLGESTHEAAGVNANKHPEFSTDYEEAEPEDVLPEVEVEQVFEVL